MSKSSDKREEIMSKPKKDKCGCHCHHKNINPLPCYETKDHFLKCKHCLLNKHKEGK